MEQREEHVEEVRQEVVVEGGEERQIIADEVVEREVKQEEQQEEQNDVQGDAPAEGDEGGANNVQME